MKRLLAPFTLAMAAMSLTDAAAQPAAATGPLAAVVGAELGIQSECRPATSIAVVPAPGSEPAGAGTFVAALSQTRLRSGPVNVVERSGLGALTTETCRSGAPQNLIFAKFIAMVSLSESGGRATATVTVAKTSTGEVVLTQTTTVSSVAGVNTFLTQAARLTNAAVSEKNYQCTNRYDLIVESNAAVSCTGNATTSAYKASETQTGTFASRLTVRDVDLAAAGTQALTGVVSLGAGSARTTSTQAFLTAGNVTSCGNVSLQLDFQETFRWTPPADVPASYALTVTPDHTLWTLQVRDAETAKLFELAQATVEVSTDAHFEPGNCRPGTNARTPITGALKDRRGFVLPAMRFHPVCTPEISVPLERVPSFQYMRFVPSNGDDAAQCSTRTAALRFRLVRTF